jgi:phage gp37-like protein
VISAIEDAIILRLKKLKYFLEVQSYSGEFDEEGLAEVVRRYPAAWITYAGGGKPKRMSGTKWLTPANFVVMVAARNVRNDLATRHGDSREVGSYQMIHDVRGLLLGQDFDGMKIEPLSPGSTRTLYNTRLGQKALSVYAIEFTTAYVEEVMSEEVVGDLLKVGLNYIIKPGDDVVDASDVVTLRS